MIELLSIDLSNYCSKQCTFCYNHSTREGNTLWKPQEVIDFASDCISHGVKAVSLGGGEPFEYEGIFDVIDALYPKCYLSVTSNGLPLENEKIWNMLTEHKPDKIHITIHKPDNEAEVNRVECQVQRIASIGIKPGLNLLVGEDKVAQAKIVYERMSNVLNNDQIILVPQRFSNTPSPKQLASVTSGKPFQSPSCLLKCQRPKNFCSVSWDKKVNSCSFAPYKVPLDFLDYNGMMRALGKVDWHSC
ncbi:MAG: radical SAM protein [Bacteroidaceae bacterium]|nr:radical SAM protein [Bacteroidaceae bacterium]